MLQSKQALPHLMNSLTHLAEMFSKMIQIGQQEMFLENDFIYVSAEIIPAYLLFGTTVVRPHAAIVLDSLIETHPEAYNGSAVTIKVNGYIFRGSNSVIFVFVTIFKGVNS